MTVDERRASGNERIPFEALVAIEAEGERRVECEALDLSVGGLRARTAYLPTLGRKLSCRFDVGGVERRAEARVVWRIEQTRGGEFGLAFDGLEPAAREAIATFCGVVPAPSGRVADRGDRVRLHINGLGSPMRARVHDAETGKLMVGSNLEFLRVGRPLSIEDVDKGKSVPAVIDEVGVRVDPSSQVPQLLVSLRCEKGGASAPAAVPAGAKGELRVSGPSTGDKSEVHVANEAREQSQAIAADKIVDVDVPEAGHNADNGGAGADASEAAGGEKVDDGASVEAKAGDEAGAGGKAAAVMAALRVSAEKLGPRLGGAAALVRGASSLALRRLRKGDSTTTSIMRTTTEMPTVPTSAERRGLGAGRDATMEEQHEAAAEGSTAGDRTKAARRWAALGGAGIAAALLATLAIKTRGEPPPGGDATRAPEAVAAVEAPAANANVNAPARPAVAGDAVTANVPLFGPTPLSTIEAVAVPPGAPVPSSFAAAPGVVAPPAGATARVDAGGGEGASSYGKGEVRRPRTVRLQMDAPIGALRGNVSDGNLVVTVPGRHNIEPAGPLARRDSRIASVKAVPVGDDTEVTLSFKNGDVPPFLAKASGRTLEIDLGRGRHASASADSDEPRSTKRHARRSHDSSGRRGAKADRDAKHESESSEKRHESASKKDDKRHADSAKDDKRHSDSAKDDKRHSDSGGEKRHAADSAKDDKRHSDSAKDDKRHADSGKDDKRHASDGKGERRHAEANKGDKRRSDRPKRERDRDDESDD